MPTWHRIMRYSDMPSRATYGGVLFAFYAFAFLTTCVRIYTRAFLLKSVGLDDVLIVAATLMTFATVLLVWYASDNYIELYDRFIALGYYEWPSLKLPPHVLREWNLSWRLDGISEFVYLLAVPTAKCSILAFYHRIALLSGRYTVVCKVVFVAIAVHGIINFGCALGGYKPLTALWNYVTWFLTDFNPPPDHIDIVLLQLVNSSIQLFWDLVIVVIPLPLLYKMRLRRSKKVGLIIVYLASCASVIVTLVRLFHCIDFYFADQSTYDSDPFEVQIARVMYLFWTAFELGTIITVANLPAMYALWRRRSESSRDPSEGTAGYFVFSHFASRWRRTQHTQGADVERAHDQSSFDSSAYTGHTGEKNVSRTTGETGSMDKSESGASADHHSQSDHVPAGQ